MAVWFENDLVKIEFNTQPLIGVRYLLPSMGNDEKKSVKKYPFINKISLGVTVMNKKKSKTYFFVIPKGYCFDGASVPRFFWRIIGSNTDNGFLVAAMVHDFLCENHNVIDCDRYLSTLVFDSLLQVSEVKSFKRFLMKKSVDIFQKVFCHW